MPYVRQPEQLVPGKPLYFATAMTLRGYALGLLVESHLGRPTKVEGNPLHPASLGATDAFAQASVLTLYDPDRSRTATYLGRIRPWSDFLKALQPVLENHRKTGGAGLRVLTGTVTSPTLASQLRSMLKEFPGARWHQYEPAGQHHTRAGARLAFGTYAQTQYRLEQAAVILALDTEPLTWGAGSLRYIRELARGRALDEKRTEMNRLYAVESTPSSVGAVADHRLNLPPSAMEPFARALASRLGIGSSSTLSGDWGNWLDALAGDLQKHRGRSVVMVGEPQPPAVHALSHAINAALGNTGRTVVYTEPAEAEPVDEIASLRELGTAMERGDVTTLLILDSNPVYSAPADFDFAAKLRKLPLSIHLGLYENETAALCHWHIPAAHYLESWSDARAYDGTATIVQPLIAPLYGGKTAHEMIAAFSAVPQRSSYEIVREYWSANAGKQAQDFERWWRKSLHDGVVEGSAFQPKSFTVKSAQLSGAGAAASAAQAQGKGETAPQAAEKQPTQPANTAAAARNCFPSRPEHLRRPIRQ